jgi:hypothetical protein
MSVEPAPKVFLQNKLSRCRAKLQELGPLMDSKSIHAPSYSKFDFSDSLVSFTFPSQGKGETFKAIQCL